MFSGCARFGFEIANLYFVATTCAIEESLIIYSSYEYTKCCTVSVVCTEFLVYEIFCIKSAIWDFGHEYKMF